MSRMETGSAFEPVHEFARACAQALGLSSAWVLATIVFAVLFVVFLAAFIVADVRRRHWRREADATSEYLRGVEASAGMDLQPILSPDGRQVDSIVFQRVNAPAAPPAAAAARDEDAYAPAEPAGGVDFDEKADTLERIRRLEQRLGRFDAEGRQPDLGAAPAAAATVDGTSAARVPAMGSAASESPLQPVPVAAEAPAPVSHVAAHDVPAAGPAPMPEQEEPASAPCGKTASFYIDSSSVTVVGRSGAPAHDVSAHGAFSREEDPADAACGLHSAHDASGASDVRPCADGSAPSRAAGMPGSSREAGMPYSTTSFSPVDAAAVPAKDGSARPDAPDDDSMGGKIPRV